MISEVIISFVLVIVLPDVKRVMRMFIVSGNKHIYQEGLSVL